MLTIVRSPNRHDIVHKQALLCLKTILEGMLDPQPGEKQGVGAENQYRQLLADSVLLPRILCKACAAPEFLPDMRADCEESSRELLHQARSCGM